MRSRPASIHSRSGDAGITSACAEQTDLDKFYGDVNADHLRVCGADMGSETFDPDCVGSPPRVRSRPEGVGVAAGHGGITSACAEQTKHRLDT